MRRLLGTFFYLLYQPLAWSYDAVAWAVSLGRWQSWIATVLPELSGANVLEIGHGPGHLQVAMRSKRIASFGLDLSPQMSRLTRHRLRSSEYLNLVRANGQLLPFKKAAFNQLVATFPTEYVLQPATLAAVRRVLRPAGSFVLLPVAWITGRGLLDRAAAWLFRFTGQAGPWTGSFSAALQAAGFSVEEKRVQLPGSEVMLLICTAI